MGPHAHVHHLHHLHDGLEHAEVGGERVRGEGPPAPGGRVRVVVDGPAGDGGKVRYTETTQVPPYGLKSCSKVSLIIVKGSKVLRMFDINRISEISS